MARIRKIIGKKGKKFICFIYYPFYIRQRVKKILLF